MDMAKPDMTKMRRADRAISREDALAVIDRCAYGTLSLIATDGTPYAVALNVVRDGKKLFFHSAPEGLKVDSLRENPQVCLLFVENPTIYEKGLTTLYTSTVVRGKVTEITDFDEKRRALRLLCDRFVPSLTKEETGAWRRGRNRRVCGALRLSLSPASRTAAWLIFKRYRIV